MHTLQAAIEYANKTGYSNKKNRNINYKDIIKYFDFHFMIIIIIFILLYYATFIASKNKILMINFVQRQKKR